jgi:hypothetical protein
VPVSVEVAEPKPPPIAAAAFGTPLALESGPAVTIEFDVTLLTPAIGTAAVRPIKFFVIEGGDLGVVRATVSATVDFSVEGVLVMLPTAELAVANPVGVLVTSVAKDMAELTVGVTGFGVAAA